MAPNQAKLWRLLFRLKQTCWPKWNMNNTFKVHTKMKFDCNFFVEYLTFDTFYYTYLLYSTRECLYLLIFCLQLPNNIHISPLLFTSFLEKKNKGVHFQIHNMKTNQMAVQPEMNNIFSGCQLKHKQWTPQGHKCNPNNANIQ